MFFKRLLTFWFYLDKKIHFFFNKKRLKNSNFTIVSDNCWAGFVYQDLQIKYNTPFVGLFLYPDCYIKFITNFESNIKLDLIFIDKDCSKYTSTSTSDYPIWVLSGTDIEIHFYHYKNCAEAFEKWNRRKKRINMNNLFFKINGSISELFLKDFLALPLKNKLIIKEDWYVPSKYSYHRQIDIISYINLLDIE